VKNKKESNKCPDKNKKPSEPPDDKLKLVSGVDRDEEPKVFKIVQHGSDQAVDRRKFFKGLSGVLLGATIGQALSGCEDNDYTVRAEGDRCTCHVVCTCDGVEDKKKHIHDAIWKQEFGNNTCVCDKVCTCNTVCTCDFVEDKNDAKWKSQNSGEVCTCD